MKATVGQHEWRVLREIRLEFIELRGLPAFQRRSFEIALLPVVIWKGDLLRSLTCQAEYGKGPHVVNVPESVLWNLIDFRRFRCPWHR